MSKELKIPKRYQHGINVEIISNQNASGDRPKQTIEKGKKYKALSFNDGSLVIPSAGFLMLDSECESLYTIL